MFVGTSYIPSIVGTQKEKIVFTSFASHGYIQDLINNASDGDTIYIPSGTYHENIFINKSISLIGEDKNTTIIDGGANVDVIFIFSDWVNISGFTIQNSSDNAGIKIISKYCNIFNNIFLDNQVGIYSYASNDNIIKRNIFIDELIDVYIFNSYNLTIINNDFWSTGLMIDSFYLEFWNSHNIQNNNLTGGKIYYYKDNSDGCNIPYDAKQIILANCSNFTIQNYSISKVGLAIQLGHSFNNSIIFNNISNTFCAIDLCCSDNNNISDNIINENEFGILVLFEYSEGNRIYCNSLNNNKHGIYFYDPPLLLRNNFNYNSLKQNKYDWCHFNIEKNTMIIENLSENIVSNNTIINNYYGIEILRLQNNKDIITRNFITKSYIAILIGDSSYKNISGNTIIKNYYGIQIFLESNNNIIYHNNFVTNIQHGYDECFNNWNNSYPTGGNYWDNYTGEDNNGDGIGDIPYPIPGGDNQDRYPFMDPCGGWDQPPNTPNIYGPNSGKPGIEYTYCINISDSDDDILYVLWDWCDGTGSSWLGPYDSGTEVCDSHNWKKRGSYTISVTVKDGYGAKATAYKEVTIPRNKVLFTMQSILIWLLERFQKAFPLFKHLLEY